ncbi:MAG: hypothetical protein AAGU14_02815 [Eubacteriaceae bacterium]
MFTKYRTLKAVKKLIENEQNPTYDAIKKIYKKCPSEKYLYNLIEEKLFRYINVTKSIDGDRFVPYFRFGEKGPQYIEDFKFKIFTSIIVVLTLIAAVSVPFIAG